MDISNFLIIIIAVIFGGWTAYLFLLKSYFKNKEFRAWRSQPHIKCTLQALKSVYQTVNTMLVSKSAWDKCPRPDYAFIYGEIDIISFIAILEVAQPRSGEVFYDLGSGAGKAIFTAALAFEFAQCKGIELVPELYNLSCQLQQSLACQPALSSRHIDSRVQFIQADFLNYDVSDADVVFINAACFIGETWKAIVSKLMQLKSGARIILGTKELPHSHFKLLNDELRYMSWGVTKVRIYIN